MKKYPVFFIKYLLFWLVYFWFAKGVFLLYNYNLTNTLTFSELVGIFYFGIKMDLSTASYLTVFPGLVLVFSFLLSSRSLSYILNIYTLGILITITLLNVADLGLYPHWGTRIGITAFDYLEDTEGLTSSVTLKDVMFAIGLFLLYFFLFRWLYQRFLKKNILELANQKWYYIPVILFFTAFLFIPIRGGLGTSPINKSTVSFSNKLYVNQVAANYLWSFVKSIERRKSYKNPCKYTSSGDARAVFHRFEDGRTNCDTVLLHIKEDDPPNVLLIILESFSNKVISSFGGGYDVCPNLDSLSSEGIIFPFFYASGNRSDRGVSALLGGYPSLLDLSIMRFPEKSGKLKMMSDYFNNHNYHTSFYYGGDIDFYNLKSFILHGGYDEIVAKKEFPGELQKKSSWGVPDSYLFQRVLDDLEHKSRPFFTVAYTLSSHVPFDVPVQIIEGDTKDAKFLNSLAYTDRCLGDFIRSFKKTDQWENTLVIITADHGSTNPGSTPVTAPETYRIPLIWTGGVVKEQAVIHRVGGQPDLIPTLLKQFNWERDTLMFGHDIFSLPSYAFYMLDLGWGYLTPGEECFYNHETREFINVKQKKNTQLNFDFAKAYLQVLHEDFLSK